jgi:hypothetical protein
MSLIAKPIVKNQLWVVTDGRSKVGNVEFANNIYSVKIGNREAKFDSTNSIEKIVSIEFQRPSPESSVSMPYATWPTTGKTYNDMFDIKRKLHVYTKTTKSKCYHVAGWFNVNTTDGWQTLFCPKYIFIQRYEYTGPFLSKDEATSN